MRSSPLRSRRRLSGGPLLVAAVLLAVAVACSTDSGSSDAGEDESADEPVGWEIGSCVHQVEGPENIPDDVPWEERERMEWQQRYEPIACSSEQATWEITELGAELELAQPLLEDDGCPDDTDIAFEGKDAIAGLPSHVVCARSLEPPHPGDPGGGGGKFLVGDCVVVLTSFSEPQVANDSVPEASCDEGDWFATVIAMEPDPGACPDEALSRIESPQDAGVVLCLAPESDTAGTGMMIQPGECLTIDPVNHYSPPGPADCAGADGDFDVYRFEAFADGSGACPDGGDSEMVTGYDRPLCLR